MMLGAKDATDRAPIVVTVTGRGVPAVCQSCEAWIPMYPCSVWPHVEASLQATSVPPLVDIMLLHQFLSSKAGLLLDC